MFVSYLVESKSSKPSKSCLSAWPRSGIFKQSQLSQIERFSDDIAIIASAIVALLGNTNYTLKNSHNFEKIGAPGRNWVFCNFSVFRHI